MKNIVQHLDDEKPAEVENEAVEQLAFADRVVLTKTDLATDEEVKKVTERIKAINGIAPIVRANMGAIDLDVVLGIEGFNVKRALELDPEFLNTDGEHQVS